MSERVDGSLKEMEGRRVVYWWEACETLRVVDDCCGLSCTLSNSSSDSRAAAALLVDFRSCGPRVVMNFKIFNQQDFINILFLVFIFLAVDCMESSIQVKRLKLYL